MNIEHTHSSSRPLDRLALPVCFVIHRSSVAEGFARLPQLREIDVEATPISSPERRAFHPVRDDREPASQHRAVV